VHLIGYGAVMQADIRSVFVFTAYLTTGRLNNITFEGFTFIDNDPASHYLDPYEETHGISAKFVDGIKILNSSFVNLGDEGADIYECTDAEVAGCLFDNVPSLCDAGGAVGINCSIGVNVHDNKFKNCSHGFAVHLEAKTGYPVKDVDVHNNQMDTVRYGVYLNASGAEVADVNIANNLFKNTILKAIEQIGSSAKTNVQVVNNKIYGGGSTTDAISLATSTVVGTVISGNTIKDWSTGDSRYGIWAYDALISNNLLVNVYNTGINAENNSAVIGNKIKNCGGLSTGNKSGIICAGGYVSSNDIQNLPEFFPGRLNFVDM
jgi:hypothetical protein